MVDKTPVFVYGSLMKGFGNHPILQDSEFVGTKVTEGVYKMVSFGAFPGLHKPEPGDLPQKNYCDYDACADTENLPYRHIVGELYLVDTDVLDSLDVLEGNGSFYQRELVLLDDGSEAWMYILMDKRDGHEYDYPDPYWYRWE